MGGGGGERVQFLVCLVGGGGGGTEYTCCCKEGERVQFLVWGNYGVGKLDASVTSLSGFCCYIFPWGSLVLISCKANDVSHRA